MGGNGEGAGSRLEKGLGIHGGGWLGVWVLPAQGWVSSPAASPALCMVRGLHLPGGAIPHHRGRGQLCLAKLRAGSQRRSCPVDLCWKPLAPPLALPLTPGLWICSARVNAVPRGRGAAGCPVWWAAGTRGLKGDWQPCPLSASVAISPAELAVTPARGLIKIRVKGRVCS